MAMATEIVDLQDEILEKVFSYIDSEERQILRRVCKSWAQVVNESYGIKLVLNNANDELLYSSPWAIEVVFESMTKSILEDIAFATNLRFCTFRNMVVFYNLIPILQSCPNIEILLFREVVIDLPIESVQMPTAPISLTHLTKLELQSWSFSDSLMTIFGFFTQVEFGQLEEIYVPSGYSPVLPIAWIFSQDLVAAEAQNNPDVHALIRLVLKNIRTIRIFTFGTLSTPIKLQFYPFDTFGSVQLEEVQISVFHEAWTTIFRAQTHLKAILISSCRSEQWGELRDSIIQNAATLKKIKLQGRTFGQTWDCGFLEATRLENLILSFPLSPKTGLRSLPDSLIRLEIDGPIDRAELLTLLNLINLVELFFKGMGVNFINVIPDEANEDRIDLPTFKRLLIRLPSLKTLSMTESSSNSMDWDEVCEWCAQLKELHQVDFQEFFYDMHGQMFRHGLSVTLPDNILSHKEIMDAPLEEQAQRAWAGICSCVVL